MSTMKTRKLHAYNTTPVKKINKLMHYSGSQNCHVIKLIKLTVIMVLSLIELSLETF